MMMEFIAALVFYLLGMTAIGLWGARNNKTGEDFLLGGRAVPVLLTLGTTVATMVGTGSSMGAVGYAYQHGWAGTLYGIGGGIGILLLAWWFAPVRCYQFMTMSEEIAYYVGANHLIKNLIAIIIYVASIGWLGAHIIGGGMYLGWLTGMEPYYAKVLLALGFSIYVIVGGYTAVVWTDSVQAILLFIGFVLMAWFSVDAAGGWQAMLAAQPEANTSWFAVDKIGWLHSVSLALAILVGILATPSFRQRIYSGKSVKTIRRSFVWSGVIYLGFSLIPAIIGMASFAIASDLENPAYAFPHMALNVLPLVLGVFIIIAGISATLSSASSDAIAGVSVLMRDLYLLVYKKVPDAGRVVLLSRLSLMITIGLALLFALTSNDIISYITNIIAILMSGLCSCGILGRFWQRFNWQGALACIVVGMSVASIVSLNSIWMEHIGNPIIPSLLSSLGAGILVSLLTPQSKISAEEAIQILAEERKAMDTAELSKP